MSNDYFLTTIKSMSDADLMSAYENRHDYHPNFVRLLLDEMNIRGYNTEEIKQSFEKTDVDIIREKSNAELIEIYHKRGEYKGKIGWDILAKKELKSRGVEVEQQTDKKQAMFRGCFSFSGRIGRLEFGLSYIIIFVYALLIAVPLSVFLEIIFPDIDAEVAWHILQIPAYWFMFSQGARRCHDLDCSGWWQLIPFFVFAMLFSEGKLGTNKYGANPKGKGNFSYKKNKKKTEKL